MKQFVGKILNIFGIIGYIATILFIVASFLATLLIGVTYVGDVREFLVAPLGANYIIEIIVYIFGFLLSAFVIFYLLNCLIHNLVGKFTFLLSLLLIIYQVLMYFLFIYMKISFEGNSPNGLNLYFIYWAGGFSVFFSFLIFVGNALNIHQAGNV